MFNRKNLILFLALLFLLLEIAPLATADGNADLEFSQTFYVAGKAMKPGTYNIIWKSGNPKSEVTFQINGKAQIKVPVKIVESKQKFDGTVFTMAKDKAGLDTLQSIRIGGKKIQIEF
jgi:hypothetical protein